jgi:hypothetical protein
MRLARLFMVLLFAVCSGIAFGQIGVNETTPEQEPAKSVHIFPYPAAEYVSIRLTNMQISKMKLTVLNILGSQVPTETEVVDEHELRIRVKELPAGYYFLALKDEETRYRGTFKFLKR